MAKMTLERADAILAKARSWHFSGDMTDVQLARKMEKAQRDGGFTMAFFSLTFLKFVTHKEWDSAITWAFFIGLFGFAIYFIIHSDRYSKIRKLFEDAGPQNLKDLSFNQNSTTDKH